MQRTRATSIPGREDQSGETPKLEQSVHFVGWDQLNNTLTGIAETLSRVEDQLRRLSDQQANSEQAVPPAFLSARDAARFLGIEPALLEYLRKSRKVRHVRIGSQRGFVYPIDSLKEYAAQQTIITAEKSLKQLEARKRGRS
jgi:hypothetical protein